MCMFRKKVFNNICIIIIVIIIISSSSIIIAPKPCHTITALSRQIHVVRQSVIFQRLPFS